jgi:hypothetical protein
MKGFFTLDNKLKILQLESMGRVLDQVQSLRNNNQTMLHSILNFGQETHFQINSNRIEEGKSIIAFNSSLTPKRANIGDEKSEPLTTDDDEDDSSVVGPLFDKKVRVKLLEFSESGTITNLREKNGKVKRRFSPGVLEAP